MTGGRSDDSDDSATRRESSGSTNDRRRDATNDDRRGVDDRPGGERPGDGRQGTTDRPGDRGGRRRLAVREGRERLWLFLRAVMGLLVVGWLLAALFVPADPFAFLLALAPLWVLAVPVAWYLVYRDGYERLQESGLFDPSVPVSQAVVAFVVVAVGLKLVGTLAGFALLETQPSGLGGTVAGVVETHTYAFDVVVSVTAFTVAYVAVFLQPFGRPPE